METCDACGPAVTAKTVVTLPSGNYLTYCLHCSNLFRERLLALGAGMYFLES